MHFFVAKLLSIAIMIYTDGQTDGQTDIPTVANTELSIASYADAV